MVFQKKILIKATPNAQVISKKNYSEIKQKKNEKGATSFASKTTASPPINANVWCAHPSAEALYKKTANTKAANVKLAVFRCGGGETQLSYRLEKRDDSLEKKEVRAEWPMEDVSCDCSGDEVGP
jgi:hypothetical protein